MKRWLPLLGLCLIPSLAFAQNAVRQQGSVRTGNIPMWKADRTVGDSGVPVSSLTPSTGSIPSAEGLNLYAAKDGADTGNCQVQITPCLTINYALNQGMGYDLKGRNLIVNIGAGTFNESVAVNGQLRGNARKDCCTHSAVELVGAGSGQTTISGDTSVCGTIVPSWGADVWLRNVTLVAQGLGCQSAIFTQYNGVAQIYEDVNFGAANAQHMHAEEFGDIEIWRPYSISGNASAHLAVSQMGVINYNPLTIVVTLTGTRAFTYFVLGQNSGEVHFGASTSFVGSATGQQFNLSGGARIDSYATTTQTIPGDAKGVAFGPDNVVYPEARLVIGQGPAIPTACGTAGLGTGCAIAVSSGGTKSFAVNMIAGSGASANGAFVVNLGYSNLTDFGASMLCSGSPTNYGTGGWNGGFILTSLPSFSPSAPFVTVNWSNNGTTLTNGQNYTLHVRCG